MAGAACSWAISRVAQISPGRVMELALPSELGERPDSAGDKV